MKKIVILISLLFSIQAFADCRLAIESKLLEVTSRNGQTNQNLAVGGVLGGILTVVYAPVGVTILGISAAGSGLHELNKAQLRKLKTALDEAYAFNEGADEGKYLKKLLKKVKRKVDGRITMQDLVNAIVDSDQSEELCGAKTLNQFAKRIHIELD